MFAIATRYFGANTEEYRNSLRRFVQSAIGCADIVIVAVNIRADESGAVTLLTQEFPSVLCLEVDPWQKFVPALNSIVFAATRVAATELLIASAEFPPERAVVDMIRHDLTEETLVVGACLTGHDHQPATAPHRANGLQIPWNTFALWNLRWLPIMNFVGVGDSPYDPRYAGAEEAGTIAVFQALPRQPSLRAVLRRVPGFGDWENVSAWSSDRVANHEKKLATKIQRVDYQMKLLAELGVLPPLVYHL